ncbi:hypothetical protein [Umezawaea beigongshangensis]|uniref:hypothetical protein n=1 Tax=Umezawaea beigongshangensis TaxID=2780383 RepID=UPI0018F11603|nr:hypothetical protein [Umezawaea beigongshangensis]
MLQPAGDQDLTPAGRGRPHVIRPRLTRPFPPVVRPGHRPGAPGALPGPAERCGRRGERGDDEAARAAISSRR